MKLKVIIFVICGILAFALFASALNVSYPGSDAVGGVIEDVKDWGDDLKDKFNDLIGKDKPSKTISDYIGTAWKLRDDISVDEFNKFVSEHGSEFFINASGVNTIGYVDSSASMSYFNKIFIDKTNKTIKCLYSSRSGESPMMLMLSYNNSMGKFDVNPNKEYRDIIFFVNELSTESDIEFLLGLCEPFSFKGYTFEVIENITYSSFTEGIRKVGKLENGTYIDRCLINATIKADGIKVASGVFTLESSLASDGVVTVKLIDSSGKEIILLCGDDSSNLVNGNPVLISDYSYSITLNEDANFNAVFDLKSFCFAD